MFTEPIESREGYLAEFKRQCSEGMYINSNRWSVPIYYVTGGEKVKVHVRDSKRDKRWSMFGRYMKDVGAPIPKGMKGALGGSGYSDGHCFLYDTKSDIGYEFFQYRKDKSQGISEHYCTWGAVLPGMKRHDGRVLPLNGVELIGARASGIALVAGVMKYEDLMLGKIPHALCVAVKFARKGKFLWPASRTDGRSVNGVPYGFKMKFPKDIEIKTGWTPMFKMMVEAVRDYGLWVVDQTADKVAFFCEDITRFPDKSYSSLHNGATWRTYKSFPFKDLEI